MSGIEVAGLVLGAFPLLVSALEHYRDCAEVFDDLKSYRRNFQKCRNKLRFLYLDFHTMLKSVLLPMICDEVQVADLLANPGGPLWSDPIFEKALKDKLKETYVDHVDAIEAVNEVMLQLKHELGLDKVDQAAGKTQSSPEYYYRRVKFALGRSVRDDLFKEFEEHNARLRRLLEINEQNIVTTALLGSRPEQTTSKGLELAQRRARSLYSLLKDAFPCSCRASHYAHLKLTPRKASASCSKFDVVFRYSKVDEEDAKPWSTRDANIMIVESHDETKDKYSEPPSVPSLVVREKTSALSSRIRKSLSKGKFEEAVSPISEPSNVMIRKPKVRIHSPPRDIPLRRKRSDNLSEISNLCLMLAQSPEERGKQCYGFLQHRDEDEEYRIFLSGDSFNELRQVPLMALLDGTINVRLSVRHRLELAATIANSDAQYWSTPWLPRSLGKESIYFLNNGDKQHTYSPQELCLAQDFVSGQTEVRQGKEENNQRLISLGVLLLELCYRKTLESFITEQWPTMPPMRNSKFDYAAALLWSKDCCDDVGPLYASAVEWCLDKAPSTIVSDDDDWHLKVFENVVIPLQQCCSVWD